MSTLRVFRLSLEDPAKLPVMFLGPLLKKAVIKSLILICLAKHFTYVAIDIYNSLKKILNEKFLSPCCQSGSAS